MTLRHSVLLAACLGFAVGIVPGRAAGQDAGTEPRAESVSRAEYEALKREMESMKAQMEAMTKGTNAQDTAQEGGSWLDAERARMRLELVEQQLADVDHQLEILTPGFSNFHIAGFGFTRFMDVEGMDSTFDAAIVPVLLWEVTDRLLFEAEIEFGLEVDDGHGETEVELEYAHGSYIINDYMTFGAGKFLTPFGLFPERLHPAWINKLPNGPLAFAHDGIAPFSSVGAYMRGGFPVNDFKFNYAFYVSNGPTLHTDEEEEAGLLGFENFEDINNNKAIGGRVGFLPIPEFEIGGSFLYGGVNATGDDVGDVDALILGLDLSYVRDVDFLAGLIDLRFEYVHSEVDDAVYDADGSLGFGPLTYDNTREGLYFQAAYRPIHCDIEFLRDLEFVGRYDWLDMPSAAPEGQHDHERWTVGINYYLNPSSALRFAYQTTDVEGEGSTDAFLAMFVIGF